MGYQPHPHAHVCPAPHHTKRFHVEHMRRIPVEISPSAGDILSSLTYQSRVLPQALSEFFGSLPDIDRIVIDLAEDLIAIDILHGSDEGKHYRFFLAQSDLAREGFESARMVDELVRLYRIYVLKDA